MASTADDVVRAVLVISLKSFDAAAHNARLQTLGWNGNDLTRLFPVDARRVEDVYNEFAVV
jgi:hypothetical protein